MDDLNRFCCLNASCAEHGKRGAGNLVACGRSGRTNRLVRCRRCHARFSERKGTVLFRAHLSGQTVASILSHVTEGVGMRKTGRLVGVKEDTVIRCAKLAGDHARALHDELVAFSPCDP
jgi:transposase-like protein